MPLASNPDQTDAQRQQLEAGRDHSGTPLQLQSPGDPLAAGAFTLSRSPAHAQEQRGHPPEPDGAPDRGRPRGQRPDALGGMLYYHGSPLHAGGCDPVQRDLAGRGR